MAQKINPTSNKLGVLQIWNCQFQKYGRTFKNYSRFTQSKDYFSNYVKHFLFQNNLLVKNIDFTYSNQQVVISIFSFNFKYQVSKIEEKIILKVLSYWLNCSIKLLTYQICKLDISPVLLNSYILYLLSLKTTSFKQILQIVFNVLKKQLEKTRLVYTTKGLQLVKLKGFKLEFTGCFESSRSQMSKTVKYSSGSVPLTKLNGYVEYSSSNFFTKFGLCGLKLWLFYELL